MKKSCLKEMFHWSVIRFGVLYCAFVQSLQSLQCNVHAITVLSTRFAVLNLQCMCSVECIMCCVVVCMECCMVHRSVRVKAKREKAADGCDFASWQRVPPIVVNNQKQRTIIIIARFALWINILHNIIVLYMRCELTLVFN